MKERLWAAWWVFRRGKKPSQVFANIYLHEFDRFVRHKLKPLAYVRYGDDAILFIPTRRRAREMREKATKFLSAAMRKITLKNAASYKSLKLAKWPKRTLDHIILDKITKAIDF